MRPKALSVVGLLILLGLTIILIVIVLPPARHGESGVIVETATNAPIRSSITSTATPPALSPQGVPAIPVTRPGDIPAFTEQDVRAWESSHAHEYQDPAEPPPVVEKVEWITSGEVKARVGNTGLPDDALLCVVTLRSHFIVHGPAGGAPYTGTTETDVYDARTGNFLVLGIGP